jgi:hypothetical protein
MGGFRSGGPAGKSELPANREEYWNYLGLLSSPPSYLALMPPEEGDPGSAAAGRIPPEDAADEVAAFGTRGERMAYVLGQGRILASRYLTHPQAVRQGLVPEGGVRRRTSDPSMGEGTFLNYYVSACERDVLIAIDIDAQCAYEGLWRRLQGGRGTSLRDSPYPTLEAAVRAAGGLPAHRGYVVAMMVTAPAHDGELDDRLYLLSAIPTPALESYDTRAPWLGQPAAIAELLAHPDFEAAVRRLDRVAWRGMSEVEYERYVGSNIRWLKKAASIAALVALLGAADGSVRIDIGPGRSSATPDLMKYLDTMPLAAGLSAAEDLGRAYLQDIKFGEVAAAAPKPAPAAQARFRSAS